MSSSPASLISRAIASLQWKLRAAFPLLPKVDLRVDRPLSSMFAGGVRSLHAAARQGELPVSASAEVDGQLMSAECQLHTTDVVTLSGTGTTEVISY